MEFRVEKDSLGTVKVPADSYYGAQTQRSMANYRISGLHFPREMIWSMGAIKKAAALANIAIGKLDRKAGKAIVTACDEVMDGKLDRHFHLDVFQAGAGTSTNMNANEVIANRATELLHGKRGQYLAHPNDQVNMSQSTNDVFHSAIHVAALHMTRSKLLPALHRLEKQMEKKELEFMKVIKSGRTHLQDAVPMRLGQEFGAYAEMARKGSRRLDDAADWLEELNLGGTAIGTGINAGQRYREKVIEELDKVTGLEFRNNGDLFEGTQNIDAIVHFSAALRTVSVSVFKMASDLRLLASGPSTGFAEIRLPAVQPGSSIMPGKVNPSIAEMVNMVCLQVAGNDTAIAMAGQHAQLELNVMMPLAAHNLLQSIAILASAIDAFASHVAGIEADQQRCLELLERNPAIATALAPKLGYLKAAEVVYESYRTRKPIRDIVLKRKLLAKKELDRLLDFRKMAD